MKFIRPGIVKLLFPQLIWEIETSDKEMFLTFDDGPHPDITNQVLEILDNYQAKATFFCVGENVQKYPETYNQILKKGHRTGNHGFHHLNGWKTANRKYLDDIDRCAGLVGSHLFRPPYGRITYLQIGYLKINYRIIMWSVLTYDFHPETTPQKCYDNAVKSGKPGSIIVFHDSEKAAGNMLFALPRFLEHFSGMGYRFKAIDV
ncbi:MAG: polysaccharide deacetylase family protein [Chlorobi bacterium]|nr:polysaccharide deacetylase family protein [Chlorobiota bacterium]